MKNKTLLMRSLIKGLFTAIFIFLFGFCALNIFWINYTPTDSLPGLYSFRAATIGDGFFLSILVGSAVVLISLGGPISSKHKRISYMFGGLFALIGTFIQISWLINDATPLNWTIPKVHNFTVAGWYHAFYFIAMFFIIATSIVQVWFVRFRYLVNYDTSILLTLFWGSGAGYIFMFLLDDYSSRWNYVFMLSVAMLVYIILAITFCFTSISQNKQLLDFITKNRYDLEKNTMGDLVKKIKDDFIFILAGTVTAYGFGLTIMGSLDKTTVDKALFFAISGTLLSAAFVVPHPYRLNVILTRMFLVMSSSFSLTIAITAIKDYNYFIGVLAILIPCIIVYGHKTNSDDNGGIYNLHMALGSRFIFFVVFSILILFTTKLENSSSIIQFIITLVVGDLASKSVKSNFQIIIQAEEKRNNSKYLALSEKQLEQTKISGNYSEPPQHKSWSFIINYCP